MSRIVLCMYFMIFLWCNFLLCSEEFVSFSNKIISEILMHFYVRFGPYINQVILWDILYH